MRIWYSALRTNVTSEKIDPEKSYLIHPGDKILNSSFLYLLLVLFLFFFVAITCCFFDLDLAVPMDLKSPVTIPCQENMYLKHLY